MYQRIALLLLLCAGLYACQQTPLPAPLACTSSGADSQGSASGVTSLISPIDGSATYHTFLSPRTSRLHNPVWLQYMLHDAPSPKALLVLIPGGQFTAGLCDAGGCTDGTLASNANSNFLVRSAHLFAARGYRVVTMERPSDYLEYTGGAGNGYLMDAYRNSLAHAVDLSAIIERVNGVAQLPVLIAGTSRGAISAVAQAPLASAIAISSPLTGGSAGDPVSHADAAQVTVPAQVLWHAKDGCYLTVPVNSYTLAGAFPNGAYAGLSGGFSPSGTELCGAISHHGFLGIESCAVTTTTDWLDGIVSGLPLPGAHPTTSPISISAAKGSSIDIDLGTYSSGGSPPLSYSLPHTTLLRGGSVALNGAILHYTAPAITTGVEALVYVVVDANGGRSHNTITITIN